MHETFPELPAWLFDLVFPSMKSRKPMAKPTTARGESYEHKPCREELSLEVISPLNHAPERQLRFGVRASDMKRPLHSRRGGHFTLPPESANPVSLRSSRERVTLCCGSDCALAVVCCVLANVNQLLGHRLRNTAISVAEEGSSRLRRLSDPSFFCCE